MNLEILSYRDAKHVEYVMKAMQDDKRANQLYMESMKIITPGSIVFGDFSQLKASWKIHHEDKSIIYNFWNFIGPENIL